MQLRKLTESDVTFTLEVEQDDTPIRGNALASGDDELDKRVEDEILARLNCGDVWAWACVTVKAQYKSWVGAACLGAVSCADEADFMNDVNGYAALKSVALFDLQAQLEASLKDLPWASPEQKPEPTTDAKRLEDAYIECQELLHGFLRQLKEPMRRLRDLVGKTQNAATTEGPMPDQTDWTAARKLLTRLETVCEQRPALPTQDPDLYPFDGGDS